jgi:diguanylate cyclase (GGDEF)-like protein
MQSVVVVDDRVIARDLLAGLLRRAGYRVLPATNGQEALDIARVEHPDLVITDILMQAMSGAEFADRLHDEPALANIQVMFYTASYLLEEARVLAKSCHASMVLAKPADSREILEAVRTVLKKASAGTHADSPPTQSPLTVPGDHAPMFVNDLSGLQRRLRRTLDQAVEDSEARRVAASHSDATAYSFHSLSLRLGALLELDVALASERDPQELATIFCRSARDIVNSSYAAVGICDESGTPLHLIATGGLTDDVASKLANVDKFTGVLGAVQKSGKAHRADQRLRESTLGLPPFHPMISSLLAVPLPRQAPGSPTGWVYFADKVGAAAFDEEDEQFAETLAAQFAVAAGNLMLYEEARQAQADLAHRLTHDQTTGLPRVALIEKQLSHAFVAVDGPDGQVIVLYLDIDRFHAVNETRGHVVGDDVLRVIAGRLKDGCEESSCVAHVAGDEFAVVLVFPRGTSDVVAHADVFRRAIEAPIIIGDQRVYLTCSIGASTFPQNGSSLLVLLRQAEAAVRRAKLDGRNVVRAFSNEQQQALDDRTMSGLRLSDSIAAGELVVHYQPQVDARYGRIFGFEALVRWQSPELGLLLPGRFLEVAEDFGLIVDVGKAVIQTVCARIRAWLDHGHTDFSVSINVSGLELQRPEFVETLRTSMMQHRVPARHIELELTEGMIVGNVERVIQTMESLKALGVSLALDDFGTGYSSLNHLRRFPIDKLKIDQSFVRDICSDRGAAGVCHAIIALGHELGMAVLAEGVETSEQADHLDRNGCDQLQGFLFSAAVPAPEAAILLRDRFLGAAALSGSGWCASSSA